MIDCKLSNDGVILSHSGGPSEDWRYNRLDTAVKAAACGVTMVRAHDHEGLLSITVRTKDPRGLESISRSAKRAWTKLGEDYVEIISGDVGGFQ